MKPPDIAALPPHIVNGETYGPQFDLLFRKYGIREMIYTSSEGEEKLFPEYFPLPSSRRLHQGGPASRRVADTFHKIAFDPARKSADLMGSFNAGWADMGLHPETFWLGYATAAAAAWHPGSPDSAESVAAFQELEFRAQRSRAHSRPVAKPTGSQLERAAGAKMAPPRTAHGPRGVGGPLRVSSPSSPGGPNGQPRQIERQRGDISNHKRLVRLHVPGGWRHTPLGWFFEADFER